MYKKKQEIQIYQAYEMRIEAHFLLETRPEWTLEVDVSQEMRRSYSWKPTGKQTVTQTVERATFFDKEACKNGFPLWVSSTLDGSILGIEYSKGVDGTALL